METWDEGSYYDDYMGRWSRVIASEFLAWVDVPSFSCWVDIGCGTGALIGAITEDAEPHRISGVDLSPSFIAAARTRLGEFPDLHVGNAQDLPFGDKEFDAAVSGLALNFVPDQIRAVEELRRVAKDEAVVAAYVWDYAEGMEMIRVFWDVAVALDPTIAHLDEAIRFPLCNRISLEELFGNAGLRHIETTALQIPMIFDTFDDFWRPLLGGQGPIPGYVTSLRESDRKTLRTTLEATLTKGHTKIELAARAWAIKAVR
jgi:SAM-dependent methyltransferase